MRRVAVLCRAVPCLAWLRVFPVHFGALPCYSCPSSFFLSFFFHFAAAAFRLAFLERKRNFQAQALSDERQQTALAKATNQKLFEPKQATMHEMHAVFAKRNRKLQHWAGQRSGKEVKEEMWASPPPGVAALQSLRSLLIGYLFAFWCLIMRSLAMQSRLAAGPAPIPVSVPAQAQYQLQSLHCLLLLPVPTLFMPYRQTLLVFHQTYRFHLIRQKANAQN